MVEQNKRKIKQVNGWKVNHPFSFGNIFYALLTLILVAVPAVYLFLPVVATGNGSIPIFTGVDLLTGFFNKFFAEMPEGIYNFLSMGGEKLQKIGPYILLGQAGLILLSALLSLVCLVFFMINIIKGYLRHARVVRVMAALQFSVCSLFAVSFVVDYVLAMIDIQQFPPMFIWWNFVYLGGLLIILVAVCITYSNTFKDVIFEADLEYHTDGEKEVVTHVTEVHNVTKVKYEPANTLPPNLTSIGGHAFAENQYLEIANIPIEVTSLGGGAFANCLKLKVVSLPEGIKEIGYN